MRVLFIAPRRGRCSEGDLRKGAIDEIDSVGYTAIGNFKDATFGLRSGLDIFGANIRAGAGLDISSAGAALTFTIGAGLHF